MLFNKLAPNLSFYIITIACNKILQILREKKFVPRGDFPPVTTGFFYLWKRLQDQELFSHYVL